MMTAGPPIVAPETPVTEVVKLMKEQGTSSILIGERRAAVGIVSEADIVRKVVAYEKAPNEVRADQVMTSPLISVDIGTPVYDIYRTMADHHIRHLLITDDDEQVGFISVKDLIAKPAF
jgi:signal-transduction protein with cAMP-binding, CBS, and nucleotidyltransferase domain